MIEYTTPYFIYKVGGLTSDKILELGPEFWKSKLYQHNTIIIDDIVLDKNSFNDVAKLFGVPWPEELYALHGEALSDRENKIVNWNHNTGLKTSSLPWHQDNPWHPVYRFPIRILYSIEVEDSTSGILTFADTVNYYQSLDSETQERYNSWELLVHDYRNPEIHFWYPFVQSNLVTGEMHLLINAIDIDVDFFGLRKSNIYQKGKTHVLAVRDKFTHADVGLEKLAQAYINCLEFGQWYHHHWKSNQIVVFSNLNVVHSRSSLADNVKRLMYRKTMFHDYQYSNFK
jgi:alpha-ketoglutarate-dependent taurine dioxygenase